MKRALPVLLLFLLAFIACKKDHTLPLTTDVTTDPGNAANPSLPPGQLAITSVAPTSGLPNTLVTIKGNNFGSSAADVMIFFNGVKGNVQSVTATEIKVLVPVTSTGSLSVYVGGQVLSPGTFTYIYPELASAYVSGDVTLLSQADVDKFVELNKGRQLQISGSLKLGGAFLYSSKTNDITSVAGLSMITSIAGQLSCFNIDLADVPLFHTITSAGGVLFNSCKFTALSFEKLRALSGGVYMSDMPELSQVNLDLAPAIGGVTISSCPKLTDMSFLSGITTATNISITGSGLTALVLDKLVSPEINLNINNNINLTRVSIAALTGATSIIVSGDTKLTSLSLPSLTKVGGKLIIAYDGITDLSGFGSLQSLGALQVYGNQSLVSLQGLEKLTNLTMSGVISGTLGSSVISRVNGIYIVNNAKLISLSGLQNVSLIPIAYIIDNPSLADLCPFKKTVSLLSTAANFAYTYRDQLDMNRTATVSALTLTNNGNYVTKTDALTAVTKCP